MSAALSSYQMVIPKKKGDENLISTLWDKKQPQLCGDIEQQSCCELTSPRALVVKEDPVDSEQVVGLSKVHHDPVGVELRGT